VSADLPRKNPASLFAIVLAAGASTRFGSPKQLVRIAGRPLLHTAVTRASEVTGSALIVVLGSGAAELGALLKHSPGSVVINQDWREGLASSIRAGIARLPLTCAGALLLLADQPAVSTDDLKRLAGTGFSLDGRLRYVGDGGVDLFHGRCLLFS